jgi:YidC/Oxa1 family membrane protein insertase
MNRIEGGRWIPGAAMKGFGRIKFLVLAMLLVGSPAVCAFGYFPAESKVILENGTLYIEFNGALGAAVAWNVQGPSMEKTRNLASATGEQVRLTGRIAGRPLEEWEDRAGGWSILDASARSTAFRLAGDELPFVVQQRWTLRDEPWLAGLEISIEARRDFDETELALVIGPGIGERPANGLGVAEGLYSFTEVVCRKSDGVNRLRLELPGESRKEKGGEGIEWIGLHSRYFAMLLVPGGKEGRLCGWSATTPAEPMFFPGKAAFETRLIVSFECQPFSEGDTRHHSWAVYGGGKSYQRLKQADLDLQSLLFSNMWDWMRLLTLGIMHLLYAIRAVVVNWGLAIICMAFLVRLVLHPIARRAMVAQKRFNDLQKKIQPEIKEIKSRYKGGEQSERIFHVYEQYGVSPVAGLKPLLIVLIQLPIFVALFYLLGQAFELRDAGFLWMETLAEPDRLFSFGVDLPFFGSCFNLLPVLMTVANVASIKMSQPHANGQGNNYKNTIFLSIVAATFFLLFYSFPSGLVLYWTMANILHLVHQSIVK